MGWSTPRDCHLIEEKSDMSTLTERYTDEAIAFMQKNKSKPFFMFRIQCLTLTRRIAKTYGKE